MLNPLSLEKSDCYIRASTPPCKPTRSQSQPPSWAMLSLHLPDNHTSNPPVDCQPRLRGLGQQLRVMSYWSWRCLTAAAIPRLVSLVPSAHNPRYQQCPQPIHYQSLAGECIGPQYLPVVSTIRENPLRFPCSVSISRVGGLWFTHTLLANWCWGIVAEAYGIALFLGIFLVAYVK